MMKYKSVSLLFLLLTACTPELEKMATKVDVPTKWSTEKPWQAIMPADNVTKGAWWEVFKDPELNKLEIEAIKQNSNLKIALSRLEQAKYSLSLAKSNHFPQVNIVANSSRLALSQNKPSYSSNPNATQIAENDVNFGLAVHYEVDLFGRVKNTIKSAEATASQLQADYENLQLLVGAELASEYFNLRELDSEIKVIEDNIALQHKALAFVKARHDLGLATGLDLAQQQALLDTTILQIDALARQRAEIEHALATIIGIAAPEFKVLPSMLSLNLPVVPLAIPSTILERRPDVASAERAMASANAQIGIAKAAFYPSVNLTPTMGLDSSTASTLLQSSSFFWSFGVSIMQPLFDGGRNRSNLKISESGYKLSIESYRLTVLRAIQEVEDGLTGTLIMGQSQKNAQISIESGAKVLDLANAKYEGGIGNYLDVILAQQSLNIYQRQAVQIRGQQYQIAVYLIKAVGGRW